MFEMYQLSFNNFKCLFKKSKSLQNISNIWQFLLIFNTKLKINTFSSPQKYKKCSDHNEYCSLYYNNGHCDVGCNNTRCAWDGLDCLKEDLRPDNQVFGSFEWFLGVVLKMVSEWCGFSLIFL